MELYIMYITKCFFEILIVRHTILKYCYIVATISNSLCDLIRNSQEKFLIVLLIEAPKIQSLLTLIIY